LVVAERVFTDLRSLIVLVGFVNGAANGYCTLRRPNASSGYTPSGTKSFRALAIRAEATVNYAAALVISQSDNDTGFATNTATVNPVYPAGAGGGGQIIPIISAATNYAKAFDFVVANTKYLTVFNQATAGCGFVTVWGYEE
jgi:hypothetical protein